MFAYTEVAGIRKYEPDLSDNWVAWALLFAVAFAVVELYRRLDPAARQ